MLRMAANVVDLLDRALRHGTSAAISRRGRYSGRVDAVVLRDGGAVHLLVRWDEQEATEPWWIVSRDHRGELVIGGPVGEPA